MASSVLLLTSDACSLVVEANRCRARVMSSDKPKNMGALGHLVCSVCWTEKRDRKTKWRKEKKGEEIEGESKREEGKKKGGEQERGGRVKDKSKGILVLTSKMIDCLATKAKSKILGYNKGIPNYPICSCVLPTHYQLQLNKQHI